MKRTEGRGKQYPLVVLSAIPERLPTPQPATNGSNKRSLHLKPVTVSLPYRRRDLKRTSAKVGRVSNLTRSSTKQQHTRYGIPSSTLNIHFTQKAESSISDSLHHYMPHLRRLFTICSSTSWSPVPNHRNHRQTGNKTRPRTTAPIIDHDFPDDTKRGSLFHRPVKTSRLLLVEWSLSSFTTNRWLGRQLLLLLARLGPHHVLHTIIRIHQGCKLRSRYESR